VFIHHVDHPIAESPKEKQRANQEKREHQVLAVLQGEKAFFVRVIAHDVLKKAADSSDCHEIGRGCLPQPVRRHGKSWWFRAALLPTAARVLY
jgi:hypothetical protein